MIKCKNIKVLFIHLNRPIYSKNIILIINKILISKGLKKFSLLLNGGGREFVGNEARKQSQNKSNKKTKQAKFS